ncbi:FAD binding domain-containing protein [Roseococcus thiosulfatophilus]|uniref:FAD binding domain-containing protein n=1 Tax=Roseococcus thiosulfatophilus TaxID=35813 RepID=UPI001A8EF8B3|nr:FAD binding domain-containing protein [Roseococcus thiosulfatophilus]
MKPVAFEHATAATLDEARALLTTGAKPMAGGQSLGPMLNLRLVRPERLVDIKRVPGLRGFTETETHLTLGAATTHAEIEDGRVPDVTNGLMRHVAGGIAYRAVRNRGTLGGSLAHADPAADWPSVMAALGATILTSGGRRLPADGFLRAPFTTALEPGEIITAVEIPRQPPGARWGYCKINRKIGEFAKAIGIATPTRLLAGAVEGPPTLLDRVEDIPARLPWLDPAAQRLAAIAVTRAQAMRDS